MKKEELKMLNIPEKRLPIEPLTLKEIHEATVKRVALIDREFRNGFGFLKGYPTSVTFFGSSLVKEGNPWYAKAQSLAERIVRELGYSIVTGGGPGIMEAANRGSFEAGGESLGLTIKLPHEQATNPYVKEKIPFYYFFARKVCLTFSAEAFVFFPGGFGTTDEFFEILTLVQTNKIKMIPIILVGREYWGALEGFMKTHMLEKGMIDQRDMDLYTITEDEDEILEIIRKAPIRGGIKFNQKTGRLERDTS